jgi:FtsH-binding integral membrane protein
VFGRSDGGRVGVDHGQHATGKSKLPTPAHSACIQLVLMSPMMDFMLSLAGAGIFSVYIVVDVHMMLHQLSPEEYILATINLYLDILNLFLNILRLLQHVNRQ